MSKETRYYHSRKAAEQAFNDLTSNGAFCTLSSSSAVGKSSCDENGNVIGEFEISFDRDNYDESRELYNTLK